MRIKETQFDALQTVEHTDEQLIIKDTILEDQLNKGAKKINRKNNYKYTSLKNMKRWLIIAQ